MVLSILLHGVISLPNAMSYDKIQYTWVSGFFWFGLQLYVQVNSYGHVGMVSSPNHTFFLGKLEQAVCQYLEDQQFHKDNSMTKLTGCSTSAFLYTVGTLYTDILYNSKVLYNAGTGSICTTVLVQLELSSLQQKFSFTSNYMY